MGLCHTFTLFDQIGRFLKVLGNQFACKSRPELDFLGYFVMYKLYVKTDVASIWATFGKLWGTFLLQYLVTLALDVSMYGSCHTVFNFHFWHFTNIQIFFGLFPNHFPLRPSWKVSKLFSIEEFEIVWHSWQRGRFLRRRAEVWIW